MKATSETYDSFTHAYDYFNRELFDDFLPDCLITLQRKANSRGYYSHERFVSRMGDEKTSEVALNPDAFEGRTDAQILSTLVHEQAHLWQAFYGKPGAARYHNKEWADKMQSLGLMPSSTGAPDGKRTGSSMSHYIIEGGRFDQKATQLIDSGFKLSWDSPSDKRTRQRKNKVKYTCPKCSANAWGKDELPILCGTCHVGMEAIGKSYAKPIENQTVQLGFSDQVADAFYGVNDEPNEETAFAAEVLIADELLRITRELDESLIENALQLMKQEAAA